MKRSADRILTTHAGSLARPAALLEFVKNRQAGQNIDESAYLKCLKDSVADVVKREPKSEGITTPRKKRPKELAIITECCTGCAGSPACVPYCPVADCMYWIPDPEHPPFGRIEVDPFLCIGCKKCVSKGPDGAFLDGCPWDAIEMVPIEDVEAQIGVKMPV